MRFMDGPFEVELRPVEAATWHLELVDDGAERRARASADVSVEPFVRSLLEACDQAVTLCRDHGWWSRDAAALWGAVENLRTVAGESLRR